MKRGGTCDINTKKFYKVLDKYEFMWYNVITSNGVYFFVRFFKTEKFPVKPQFRAEGGNNARTGNKVGGAESES